MPHPMSFIVACPVCLPIKEMAPKPRDGGLVRYDCPKCRHFWVLDPQGVVVEHGSVIALENGSTIEANES